MSRVATVLQKPPESLKDLDPELYTYLNTFIARLERILTIQGLAVAKNWAPTNVPAASSTYKEFNSDTATLQVTSRALGLLIQELKNGGTLASTDA